jgi:hypothetical protein
MDSSSGGEFLGPYSVTPGSPNRVKIKSVLGEAHGIDSLGRRKGAFQE